MIRASSDRGSIHETVLLLGLVDDISKDYYSAELPMTKGLAFCVADSQNKHKAVISLSRYPCGRESRIIVFGYIIN